MAKQLGVIQYSGKLGETVGAKKAAGQRSNVIRVRTASISNPRSNAQAAQRMKMAPAVNFYRALREILNHSWQGVSYGGASHSKFMKEAMRAPVYPYIPKGTTAPIPAPYKISIGSLSPITVKVDDGVGSYFASTNINMSGVGGINSFSTIGELSRNILARNPQLQDGDQLTFISAIMGDMADILDSGAMFRVSRLVLNKNDEEELGLTMMFPDEEDGTRVNGVYLRVNNDDTLSFCHANMDEAENAFFDAGAAVIVSRPSITKGKVTWERSTQSLVVSQATMQYLTRADRYNECLETYKNSVSASSEWFLNGGNNNSGSDSGSVQGTATVTLNNEEGMESKSTLTGAGTYNLGELVTVKAALNSGVTGYGFSAWFKNGVKVSESASYQFVLNGNVTLTAKWAVEEQP